MVASECTDRQLIELTERLDPQRMRPNEDQFLRSIQTRDFLTPKQLSWLESILEKHGVLDVDPNGARGRTKQAVNGLRAAGWRPQPALPAAPTRLGGTPDFVLRERAASEQPKLPFDLPEFITGQVDELDF